MFKLFWEFMVLSHEFIVAFVLAYLKLLLEEEKEILLNAFLNFNFNN
jgi:hypothetical protein